MMSYIEIAKVLGISVFKVKKAEKTGLAKLRKNKEALKILMEYLQLNQDHTTSQAMTDRKVNNYLHFSNRI